MLLDASVVLALLNDEPGADEVKEHVGDAIVSAVNLAEVAGKLADYEIPNAKIGTLLAIFDSVPFGEEELAVMSKIRIATKKYGLSLGDRCCLATALVHKEPILTADRAWAKVKIRGLKIVILKARTER